MRLQVSPLSFLASVLLSLSVSVSLSLYTAQHLVLLLHSSMLGVLFRLLMETAASSLCLFLCFSCCSGNGRCGWNVCGFPRDIRPWRCGSPWRQRPVTSRRLLPLLLLLLPRLLLLLLRKLHRETPRRRHISETARRERSSE